MTQPDPTRLVQATEVYMAALLTGTFDELSTAAAKLCAVAVGYTAKLSLNQSGQLPKCESCGQELKD